MSSPTRSCSRWSAQLWASFRRLRSCSSPALLGMRAAGLAALLLVLTNTLLYLATGMELSVAFGASIVAAAFCLGIGVIIARLRSDKRRIERLTVLDRLTGLPNRDAFDTKVQSMVAAGGSARIALVDVFGFRDVNESFGHDVGDDVIREIAPSSCGDLQARPGRSRRER